MRLDKYLSIVKILKSRSLVKTAADEGMVFVDGSRAKPSLDIRLDHVIEVDTPRFYKKIRVVELPPKNMKKSEAVNMYEILEERKKELI